MRDIIIVLEWHRDVDLVVPQQLLEAGPAFMLLIHHVQNPDIHVFKNDSGKRQKILRQSLGLANLLVGVLLIMMLLYEMVSMLVLAWNLLKNHEQVFAQVNRQPVDVVYLLREYSNLPETSRLTISESFTLHLIKSVLVSLNTFVFGEPVNDQ